jgi:hypothetical protein
VLCLDPDHLLDTTAQCQSVVCWVVASASAAAAAAAAHWLVAITAAQLQLEPGQHITEATLVHSVNNIPAALLLQALLLLLH